MTKFIIILLFASFFSCSEKAEKLDNGLTRSAEYLTEYTIKIGKDSTDRKLKDTLVRTKITFNDFDKIKSRDQYNIFSDDYLNIEFQYDEKNLLIKEKVRISSEKKPIIISYTNKNSKPTRFVSETEFNDFYSKNYGNYEYDNGELVESTSSQLIVDKSTSDTLANTLETNYYKNDEVERMTYVNNLNPKLSRQYVYKYDKGNVIEMRTFNLNDSLISTTNYKYELDEFNNWIVKNTIVNGNITFSKARVIKYK